MTPFIAPAAAILAASLAADAAAPPVPRDIVFDVYRNGTEFGEHAVRFDRAGNGSLIVDIDVELQAGFGPLTLFRYEHRAEEVWRDGELVRLTASTLKDGERKQVDVERLDENTLTSSGDPIPELPPSSHWRGYDPATHLILNTETGDPMDVVVEDLGMDTVETAAGPVEARHVRVTGTLTMDLWYDGSGRWIGCTFQARGHTIDYVLRNG